MDAQILELLRVLLVMDPTVCIFSFSHGLSLSLFLFLFYQVEIFKLRNLSKKKKKIGGDYCVAVKLLFA